MSRSQIRPMRRLVCESPMPGDLSAAASARTGHRISKYVRVRGADLLAMIDDAKRWIAGAQGTDAGRIRHIAAEITAVGAQ